MSAVPSEYAVLTNLRDALAGIRVGDGFYYDVLGSAVKLDPNHDVDALWAAGAPRPFVVIQLESDQWTHDERPQRARIELRVIVHWIHDSDPTRDADKLQTYLQGCADVEKAIAADLQLGGLAIATKIVGREMASAVDGALVEALIEVAIVVRRGFGEPSVTV